MKAFLIVPFLLTLLPRAKLHPLHYSHPDPRNRIVWHKKNVAETDDVLWGQHCSPRFAWLRPQQDAVLQCEIFAPSGTVLTWYKDQAAIRPQIEAVPDATNSVLWKGKQTRGSTKSVSKVRVKSTIYIDCASAEDMGEYSLKVQTPDHQVFTRNFSVTFSGSGGDPGPTCSIGKTLINFLPRIYQYAPQALAQSGEDVTLPCRQQGRDSAVTWYLQNSPLPGDSTKYMVRSNGDLLIRRVNLHDRGLYRCRAASTFVHGLSDQIHTFLYPMP